MCNNHFKPLPSISAANQRPTLAELPAANQRPTLAELQNFTVNGETVNIITDVADNWRRVGAAFNFDPAGRTLNRIDQKFPNRPEDCCREMFQTWLKTIGATWKRLVKVLESSGKVFLLTLLRPMQALLKVRLGFESSHLLSFYKIIFTRQS